MSWYWLFFGIVFFATFAMTVREGIWNNLLLLAYITISGLVAFGFYQPLVILIDEKTKGEYTYLLDMPIVWGIFTITIGVLKVSGTLFSRTRVLFPEAVDNYAGPAVGLICAWLLGAFTLATFHMAPLSKDALNGRLTTDAVGSTLSSPDRAWLAIVDLATEGGSLGTGVVGKDSPLENYWTTHFVATYADRRAAFEKISDNLVHRTGG